MPILKNAQKALRVSLHKAEMNRQVKSQTKTAMDAFKSKPSAEGLATAFSRIDRAVKNNIFHKNKAARMKSALSSLLPASK